jgi:hypothetical protein
MEMPDCVAMVAGSSDPVAHGRQGQVFQVDAAGGGEVTKLPTRYDLAIGEWERLEVARRDAAITRYLIVVLLVAIAVALVVIR